MVFVDNKKIWIALANVEKRIGFENIIKAHGAYVNILIKAENIQKLKLLVKKIFFEEGFVLINLEDIELLSDRLKKHQVDQDILDLVDNLSDLYPVQFGIFHAYPEKDTEK